MLVAVSSTARRAACGVVLALVAWNAGSSVAHSQSSPSAPTRIALWAQRGPAATPGIDLPGSDNSVHGAMHSNGSLKIGGSKNSFQAAVTYVGSHQVSGSGNTFAIAPAAVAARPLPYTIDIASFAPGGPVQQALGAAYVDKSSVCASQGKWQVSDSQLPLAAALYYVPCEVEISGSSISGRLTLVSTHPVQVSGSQVVLTPYYRGIQIATSTNANEAVKLSGSRLEIGGLVWAPNGTFEPSGSEGRFSCGIVAGAIKLSGANNRIGHGLCGAAPVARDSAVSTPEDTAVAIVLDASDVDLEVLHYQVIGAPSHGTLSGTAPRLTYAPAANYFGADELTFRVVDSYGETATAKVRITVTPVNDAPVAQPQSLATDEDVALSLSLTGTDPEGDPVTYAVLAAPSHGSLSGTPPALLYTPAANYHGTDRFTFAVRDGTAASAPATIDLTLRPINDVPTITTTAPTSTQTRSDYRYDVDASDVDGDTLSYSLVAAPPGMTIDAVTGVVSWTPSDSQVGDATVRLEVRDDHDGHAEQSFTISVAASNRAPIITSTAPTAATTGASYSYDVDATDADGDALSYSLVTAPTGMTIDATTGVIAWTPTEAQIGPAPVTVRVSDGRAGVANQTFIVTVVQSNRVPVIASTAPTGATTGVSYSYDVDATDADGDALSYTLVTAPTGMTIDPTTGVIAWTPSEAQIGPAPVALQVSDGHEGVATQIFTLAVTRANRAPTITSTAPTAATAGAAYVYDVDATDADGDALNYTLVIAPAGMQIDAATGAITWEPGTTHIGEHAIKISVVDPADGRAEQSFTLRVTAANQAPAIISTPTTTVEERSDYTYDIEATDPNLADRLRYSLDRSPEASIDAATGLVRWTAPRAVTSLRAPLLSCRASAPPISTFDPTLRWHWTGSTTLPNYNQVMMTPLVVQTSDDNADGAIDARDVPDVAFVSYYVQNRNQDGVIRIVDGASGRELLTMTDPRARVTNYSQLAAADIDGDGLIEFIGVAQAGGLVALEHDGTIKWASTQLNYGWSIGAPAIADLEGDGQPDIIFGNGVLNADGSLKWKGSGRWIGSNQANITASPLSFAADITDHPGLEVVAGASVYTASGQLLWLHRTASDSFAAVGDLDGDRSPEIVVVATSNVTAFRADGSVLWGPKVLAEGWLGGAPTIADFDGNGRPEIGIANQNYYHVLDADGTERWKTPITDGSTSTGSTSFDFDGDGAVEIVQADELNLRVMDGRTGETRWSTPNRNGTALEYPVVADADQDGSADILVASNLAFGGTQTGLRMFSSASRRWLPTRSMWNQHAYHIDNIQDDGRVPRQPAKSWLSHNTFRLNTFADRHALDRPDLALFDLRLNESDGSLSVLVTNRGRAPTTAATPVHFYNGDPSQGGTLLGEVTLPALAAGEEQTLTLGGLAPNAVNTHVFALVDEAGAITECLDDNNATAAAYFEVRATDPTGLFDSQRFTVTVENVNEAPSITTDTLPPAAATEPYRFRVQAQDPDIGDGLRFDLIGAPAGLSLDPYLGELRWTPLIPNIGTHPVRVRVTDLGGLSVERNFTLSVTGNRAPEITSTAITTAIVGGEYQYDVEANDADGDSLSYALVTAPVGMTIDASSGLIMWTPNATQGGEHSVTVQASDGRGGQGSQSYTIRVEARVNNAPAISSTGPASVDEGARYDYDVDATDPDGDSVIYSAPVGPSGHAIDPNSGALAWLALDANVQGLRTPNLACRIASEGVLQVSPPVRKWHFTGAFSSLSLPLVAPWDDTNQDGDIDAADAPRILVFTHRGSVDEGESNLQILDAATGTKLRSVDGYPMSSRASAHPAIGDLEGDGHPDIVYYTPMGGLIALDHEAHLKWRVEVPGNSVAYNYGAVTLADLEGDGRVEVLARNYVLNHDGSVRFSDLTYPFGGSASGLVVSVAVDLDRDGVQEVLIGNRAYAHDGRLLWISSGLAANAYGHAIGNLDDDPFPEIVVTRPNVIAALNHDGSVLWQREVAAWNGGPISIGDIDGDGAPEIVQLRNSQLMAFKANGSTLWSVPVTEGSDATGVSLFDFDGDGTLEVVHADHNTLRVLDGRAGMSLWQLPNGSTTASEYPVIADIDQDGHAEILVSSDVYPTNGLRALQSSGQPWMAARSLWNQYAYHVDNVDDDGRLPRQVGQSWRTHNTFRAALDPTLTLRELPDLALFDLRLDESSGTAITVQVTNRGLAPTTAATTVRFHNGHPDQGGTLLGTLAVPALAAGDERSLTLNGVEPIAVTTDLYARIDEADAIGECLEQNNHASAAYFEVRASDAGGLYDAQRFTVTVENLNEAPTIQTSALPPATLAAGYRFPIEAVDPDVGDGLRFQLVDGPLGLRIEAVSGELRWTPTTAQAGTHTVRVRVTDLGGLWVERSFELAVTSNNPPQFTSTAITTATLGSEYRYDVEATDAEGETLTYALNASPSGMQIDAVTGLIRWTPAANAVGAHAVDVRVSDARGAFALQRYTLTVSVPANHPPVITSTPSASASAGRAYTYLVDATDADGDVLSVLLPVKPAGMTLNEFSGQISWTPTAAQLGTHAVQVQVNDGRGGIATQNFNVIVSAAAENHPPRITSLPTHTAKVGKTYLYPATATDPDGDPLTWSVQQGPAGMTVNASTGALAFTPTQSGAVEIVLRTTDGDFYADQSWTLTVLDASVTLAGTLDLTPNPVAAGAELSALLVVSGAAGPVTVTATLEGTPIALNLNAPTALTAPTAPGEYQIAATLDDGHDTVTLSPAFHVIDPNDTSKPTATIHEPLEAEDEEILVVTAPRPVKISVNDDALLSWTLRMFERGAPGSEAIELASGTAPVNHAHVAKLDPTLLDNGQYALILEAKDQSGNVTQDVVSLSIEGAMKLGHFSMSFEDLSLPVAGLPVSVTRTYDTRQRHRSMDFGYGWSLAYRSVKVQESRRPGFGWQLKSYPSGPLGLIPNWCVESARGNVVSVTRPDGKVEKFRAVASPACNQVFAIFEVDLQFEPLDGTHGKLVALNDGDGRYINNALADAGSPTVPLDPSNYRYIDAEGLEYTVDQGFGLRQLHERPGDNTITFGHDGIVHSNGTSVSFVRDAVGRVSKIVAPDQSERSYEYDANGNLAAVVDFGGHRTAFTYLAGHYLQDIIDARGVRVARNEYDDDGRLVAVIDAEGKRVEYTHNVEGRVERIKDRRGNTSTYVFNDRGDVLAETDALNHTRHHSYDADGNELTQTDPLGRIQRWTYDALGNVLTETNAEDETTTSGYGKFNQLLTQTDAANRVVMRNVYRNQSLPGTGIEIYPGPLVKMTDANNAETVFGYDAATGELSGITDAAGATSRFEMDARGYKLAEVDALGHRATYVNDELGRVTEERRTRTTATGAVETLTTRYTYDDAGRVTATEHPDGSVTRTEYNAAGQVDAEIDALNRRTEHVYNDRGEETETRYADGTVETKAYDANGNVTAQTDRGGRTTKFVFDAANRLTETIHPDAEADDGNDANNPRSTSVYDAAGQLVESVDETGQSTRYGYDDAGRRTTTTLTAVNGASATLTDAYDDSGRRTSSTDAEGHVTTYHYDAGGRLIETRHEGTTTRVEYDAAGRKLAEFDAEGRITRYGYDVLGRLTTVVLPNPVTGANPPLANGSSPDVGTLTTRYTYDELGNKLTQTDAEGRTTQWEYDAMGRELARLLPEGQRETKEYNVAGELVAHTDFNGRTTRYRYSVIGQPEAIDYATDADVAYGYNTAGERTTVTDGRGESTTDYDRRGRVVQSHDADGGLIEYEYDDAGRLLARISPSQSLSYTYDTRGRLDSVIRTVDGEAPTTTRYEYDQDGNRAAMLGGDGVRTEYTYDRRHRLTDLVKKTAAGAVFLAMNYTVDASGMRTGVEESDTSGLTRTVAYAYDATKRLTRETIDHRDNANDRVTAWTYDDVGNRLAQTLTTAGTTEATSYVYDANDRLGTETRNGVRTTYAYDPNGNTLSKSSAAGEVTYAYDEANRLIRAVDGSGSTNYVYTADGLRIRKVHTPSGGVSTTTWYVQDTGYAYAQVIEEYTSRGAGEKQLAATFTFADELVSQTRYDTGSPVTRFVHADGFGSTRWLTDGSGAVTDTVDYDAFGVEIARAGSTDVEHLYRGEAFDPNVGFYYLRARWMDPHIGRFVTQDTYMGNGADPASLHKYLYASSAPTLYTDPSGHMNLPAMTIALTFVGKTLDVSFYAYAAYTGGTSALATAIVEDLAFMIIPGSGVAKAPSRIAAIFARSKSFKLAYPALGRTLAHNLRVFGFHGPFKWAAHHIVPGLEKYASAIKARGILQRWKIDINSPLNGAFLDPAIHAGRHLEKYSDEIYALLSRAEREGGGDAVRATLHKIQEDMRTGTSELLQWL